MEQGQVDEPWRVASQAVCCVITSWNLTTRASCLCAVQVMLIIDQREQYNNSGKDRMASLARHVQTVRDRNIAVDVRTLHQGDVLWIAKSRCVPWFVSRRGIYSQVSMPLSGRETHSQ